MAKKNKKSKKIEIVKPQSFQGALILKEFMQCPDGSQQIVLVGSVVVSENKDLVGFDASNREANWTAVVSGKKTEVGVFGCQIKAIHRGDWQAENCYRVK